MGHFLVFLLYAVYALVLGILAVVLKRKHTKFSDFRVGYHNKKAMESKEKWDRANAIAGSLCAVFAVAALIAYFILYLQNANISTMIIAYFVYCAVTIPAVLILLQKSPSQPHLHAVLAPPCRSFSPTFTH